MRALGTSPPQELICFRWGKVITYKRKKKGKRVTEMEKLSDFFFPIITVDFFSKNMEWIVTVKVNINDIVSI